MSVILSTLRDLARTLGCGDHQVETVVREERSAHAALSRRGLFKAAGAVALGTVVSAPVPKTYEITLELGSWVWVKFGNSIWTMEGGQAIAITESGGE